MESGFNHFISELLIEGVQEPPWNAYERAITTGDQW